VIHDKANLDVVFIVKKIPSKGSRKRRAIKSNLLKVKKGLHNLARGRSASNALERRIIKGTPRSLRTRHYYSKAKNRLRCQRGVDILPSLKNSRKYLGMIKRVFRKYKVPEDLAYLPHLESGFNHKARSHAGARGLWQFVRGTARQFGLRVGLRSDQRISPYKSTVAAAKKLRKLKKDHKSWPLAVTAYNYGTNGMRRAIKKYGHDYMKIRRYHRTRIFGFAVKNYYPSFLAVRNVTRRMSGDTKSKTSRKTASLDRSSRGRLSL
jgi:membrane-bound lytic murein transglycosylase D